MKRYLFWIAITGVAIVAIYTWRAAGGEAVPARVDDRSARDIAALRVELAALRAREPAAIGAPDRGPPAPPASPVPAAADGSTETASPPAPAKQRMPGPAELAVQLDDRFAAQDVDPVWSQDAMRRVTEALSSSLPSGTTLGAVECRASLCRVESFHTSVDAFRSFVDASLLSRDRRIWNGATTSIVTDTSGPGVKALSFIAREGAAIPAMEPVDG